MNGLKDAVGDPHIILRKVSSIVTDGTNVKTGDKHSLWELFEKETKSTGSEIPLIKIWCAAHRAELAWKSISKTVPEVNRMLSLLSGMSSHFHYSAMRTAELKQIAADENLPLLMLPKIFEIRWSQFTFNLVRSVLVSWQVLVIYFKRNEENAECSGYFNFLTKLQVLRFIAFLADLLFTFSRFQQKLQSNQLTLITMQSNVALVIKSLNQRMNLKLPGGCESKLDSQLQEEDEDKFSFKSIELQDGFISRRSHFF